MIYWENVRWCESAIGWGIKPWNKMSTPNKNAWVLIYPKEYKPIRIKTATLRNVKRFSKKKQRMYEKRIIQTELNEYYNKF